MIFRVTALLKSNDLVEGWARNEEQWRDKLTAKFGENADGAFIYTYGSEPKFLTWNAVDFLKTSGYTDDKIKRVFDETIGELKC